MKKLLLSLTILVVVSGVASSVTAANVGDLREQNPFLILDQLTEFSYEDLAAMYPALSDIELRSLRWRIVNAMQGLE